MVLEEEDAAPLTPRSCRTSAEPSDTSRLDLGGLGVAPHCVDVDVIVGRVLVMVV